MQNYYRQEFFAPNRFLLQPSDGQTIQTKTKTKGIRLHARFDVHPQLK